MNKKYMKLILSGKIHCRKHQDKHVAKYIASNVYGVVRTYIAYPKKFFVLS